MPTLEDLWELKGIILLKQIAAAGGSMFVEDTGSARTCLYLEDKGWVALRLEEGIEIVEITEAGRKIVNKAIGKM